MIGELELTGYGAAKDWIYAHSLNDGLPVVPPTADLVDAMIAGGGSDRDALIGVIERRSEGLSVEGPLSAR